MAGSMGAPAMRRMIVPITAMLLIAAGAGVMLVGQLHGQLQPR